MSCLNASKCCCLLLSHKISHSIPLPTLTLGDVPLDQDKATCKYLDMLITSNLMWSMHSCHKYGILCRQFYKHSCPSTMLRIDSSFIRSHPSSQVCNCIQGSVPQKDDIVEQMENIQKFALSVCTNSWNA